MLSQFSEAILVLLAFSSLAFWRGGMCIMRCPNCDSSPQAVYEAEVFYVSIVWKILGSSPSGSGMCGCVGVGGVVQLLGDAGCGFSKRTKVTHSHAQGSCHEERYLGLGTAALTRVLHVVVTGLAHSL